MTKKHLAAIAAAVKSVDPDDPYPWVTLSDRLADVCAAANPRFDRRRFLEACGRGGGDAVPAA